MLWEIVDTPHKLLGSVHILPAETVFPNWVDASHNGIERFVFESGGEPISHEIGIDYTLAHLKSPSVAAAYKEAADLMATISVYDSVEALAPWAMAFHLVFKFIPVLGLSHIHGVEFKLREIATKKGLKIDFLESSSRSQELIDLSCKSADGGLDFLNQTISSIKSGDCWKELQRISNAWFASDLVDINSILNENLTKFPSVFYPIITQRNQEWGNMGKRLCADTIPTLFVVGCLHTVGNGSFIEHLESNGLRLRFIA